MPFLHCPEQIYPKKFIKKVRPLKISGSAPRIFSESSGCRCTRGGIWRKERWRPVPPLPVSFPYGRRIQGAVWKYRRMPGRGAPIPPKGKRKKENPWTSAEFRGRSACFPSGATTNRTRDTRIFSPLLYQLSYGTISSVCGAKIETKI